MKTYISTFICLLFVVLISKETQAGDPLFPNSVVSNDIDFILSTDPDTFESLAFLGREDQEMPGNGDDLFDIDTFVFEATFSDGETLEIWCHSSFDTEEAAQGYAEKLCPRLGKLPLVQREMLDHVVINTGNHTAFAETQGHFFVLYSINMDARISTHDLEETVFHESVHASLQDLYENDPAWIYAQENDPSFVTDYAQSLLHLEDMPESALFAYTFITHPGRLSADIETWLMENIPHRIEFFRNIYPSNPAGVDNELSETKTHVYPNPTSNSITVLLENLEQDSQINIYKITGKMVKSVNAIQGLNKIDLGKLSNGVYFLSAPAHQTTRIIKQ